MKVKGIHVLDVVKQSDKKQHKDILATITWKFIISFSENVQYCNV